MSTHKANHWGWAVPGVCCVSPESASFRVSSKDRIEPSTVNMTSPSEGSEGDELRLPVCSCASAAGFPLGGGTTSCHSPAAPPCCLGASRPPHCALASLFIPCSVWTKGTVIPCFCSLSYLFLKSIGLLLKSCCSEIIDDVHHSPVCRIGRPSIFHGTAKHRSKVSECATNAGINRLTALPSRTRLNQRTRSLLLTSLRAYSNLPTGLMMLLLCLNYLWSLLILE